jgi:hypothetical protein
VSEPTGQAGASRAPAETLLVLHALRLRNLAEVDAIAARFTLDPARVAACLDELSRSGWAAHRDGRFSGWRLTSAGRTHGQALLAGELDLSGSRDSVEADYEAFLGLNPELLAICTDWQVVDTADGPVVNDHADPGRDAAVLDRLDRVHEQVVPVTRSLAGSLWRFRGYTERLGAAHERVRAGDHEWITAPSIDSYHTVWFELHEDLLATLGRERSQERSREAGETQE